jgi:hypothetical protein
MLSLCLNNNHRGGNNGIAPHILNNSTRLLQVASFTSWLLYPRTVTINQLQVRLDCPQNQSRHGSKKKNP